ncbi:FAD-dependent monooxygenase [Litorimonas haliclonae]|uniref:FAD-dependent monooxygenase n=1 Tax=Litorimonas haliclonae TaxID=2081977 RepID=UPI0039EF35B5
MKNKYDILIVGGGLVGQVTALACAKLDGLTIALADGRDVLSDKNGGTDGRASALSASSLRFLNRLELILSDHLQPMRDMLITDGGIGEDPVWRLHFGPDASDSDVAKMIENRHLYVALRDALKAADQIDIIGPGHVSDITHTTSGVFARIGTKDITAQLLIAADGSKSGIRNRAGITTDGREYGQRALVTSIAHSLPHDGLALQRFLPGGPLAVLPLTGQRSQLVWSDKSAAIEAALAISEADFMAELTLRIGDHLGDLSLDAPRQSYPLHLQLAQDYIATRLVLVGDAAHVIHPLAGQGLNLGLRDAATLHDVLKKALLTGRDIGGAVLREYAAWRRSDVTALATATDGLSYIFGAPKTVLGRPFSKALGHVRRLGLSAVNDSAAVKGLIMREAAGDIGEFPEFLKK